jgi:hypothetical protein
MTAEFTYIHHEWAHIPKAAFPPDSGSKLSLKQLSTESLLDMFLSKARPEKLL